MGTKGDIGTAASIINLSEFVVKSESGLLKISDIIPFRSEHERLFLKNINRKTVITYFTSLFMEYFGVIGYPIKHSLSPAMHNAAFRHLRMEALYLALEVRPNSIGDAIKGAKALGFTGLNITIPFKESVLEYVKVKGIARKIGAVNTVDLRNMEGYNTDAYGALKALRENGVDVEGKAVLIIGAGGAARAIAFALAEENATIVVTNRTQERGLKLAEDVRKTGECIFYPLDRIEEISVDIIINATPLGMKGFEEKLPVPESIINDVIVFDTVYNPKETPLILLAKRKGCKVVYGMDMLVYQGAESFRIWTGREAPVDVMKKAVMEELKRCKTIN